MRHRGYFLFICLALLTGACQKTTDTQPQTEEELPLIMGPNTLIVKQANASLLAIDNTKLVFDSNNQEAASFKVGTILASDIHAKAPSGYLRKVVAKSTTGGQITLTTEPASLEEAIQQGSVVFKTTVKATDIVSVDSFGIAGPANPQATSNQRVTGAGDLTFSLKKTFTSKNNPSSKLELTGSASLVPSITFELIIKDFKVQKLLLKQQVSVENKIKGTLSTASKKSLFSASAPIKKFHLPPLRILIGGVFPLTLVNNTYEINTGVEASISGKFEASASSTYSIEEGISYEKGSWTPISSSTGSTAMTGSLFEGKLTVMPFVEQKLVVQPYGLPDSEASLGLRYAPYKGEATITSTATDWKITEELVLAAKANVTVFSKTMARYEQELFKSERPVVAGSTAHDMYTGTTKASGLETVGYCQFRRNYTATISVAVPHTAQGTADTLFARVAVEQRNGEILSGGNTGNCIAPPNYTITGTGGLPVANNQFVDNSNPNAAGYGTRLNGTLTNRATITGILVFLDPNLDNKLNMPYTLTKQ